MIMVKGNTSKFEGHPKDLCVELTYLLSSFKDTLIKEYNISDKDANTAIAECCNIAFMNAFDRKNYLDKLVIDYRNKH